MTLEKRRLLIIDPRLYIQDLATAYFRSKRFEVICYNSFSIACSQIFKELTTESVILIEKPSSDSPNHSYMEKIQKDCCNYDFVFLPSMDEFNLSDKSNYAHNIHRFAETSVTFSELLSQIEKVFSEKSKKESLKETKQILSESLNQIGKIVGNSKAFLEALDLARRAAFSQASILITGESGTGKEVVAKFIHSQSRCSEGPFVAINCAAIPENLLESELFGHAKGAFTGASEKRVGLFEEAQDGTLFLDEIGDLSLPLQAKLLRVLQEKKIKRVGENQTRPINCRMISATHKDLVLEMKEKRFREDLFFRLDVIPIRLPPLRERKEDLPTLAQSFLKKFAVQNNIQVSSFSKEALQFILENPWRGNVRELENAIERAVVLSQGSEVQLKDLLSGPLDDPFTNKSTAFSSYTNAYADDSRSEGSSELAFTLPIQGTLPRLEEVVKKYILFSIKSRGGALDKTAKELGIDRKTLYRKIKDSEDTENPNNLQ